MYEKKLVSRKNLNEFSELLNEFIEEYPNLEQLKYYFDCFILDKAREDWNEMKRDVYRRMKETTGEENRRWYNIYQNLKILSEYEERGLGKFRQ